MHTAHRILLAAILTVAALLGGQAPVLAQTRSETATAKPGFRVAPMKLKLSGRPGQVLPFELDIFASTEARTVKVQVVDLAQSETGAIGPADTEPESPMAVLDTESHLTIPAGGSVKVRGRAFVRAGGASFRAFGVLVSEVGAPAAIPGGAAEEKTTLALRFNIRYLARVEVAVRGARDAHAKSLRIVDGGLVDRGGRAEARLFIENPTESAFKAEVDCQVFQAGSRVRLGPSFPLVLPVQKRRVGKQRTQARIIPGARVRLEALVPEPISPGDYVMVTTLRAGNERVRVEFPISVEAQDFPAQATLLPRVVSSVRITPPRVELAVGRGGARMVPLLLENGGEVEVELNLSPEPRGDAAPADWLIVRPKTFRLAPGATRRVAAFVTGGGDVGPNRYAFLRVRVGPGDGSPGGEQRIPVAFVGTGSDAPDLVLGALGRDGDEPGLAFAVEVANRGSAHVALDGKLLVIDPYGRVLEEVAGGFGAWLLPGAKDRVLFRLNRPVQAGTYTLRARFETGSGGDPREVEAGWTAP